MSSTITNYLPRVDAIRGLKTDTKLYQQFQGCAGAGLLYLGIANSCQRLYVDSNLTLIVRCCALAPFAVPRGRLTG